MESIARSKPPRRARRLYAPEVLRARLLQAYYIVLNQDSAFRSDFERLFELAKLPPWSVAESVYLCGDAEVALAEFAEKWHLPRDHGPSDVWSSFYLAAVGGADLILELGGRSYMAPIGGTITPALVPPFEYDPTRDTLDRVRERAEQAAEQVRLSIISQAEAFEQEARALGFSEVPPRQLHDDEVVRMARRLYRAAVLGQGWTEIAEQEDGDYQGRDTYPDPQSVRATVNEWAKKLGIDLPKQARGPRKNRR